ncbi:AMP-binding protein, partial [Pseudomonas aeruginosa]|nr:AMP-binding protein [Pseudomonas aeruginosa]
MVTANRLPLEVFFEREKRHPQRRYLVQPIGGGRVEELSWGEVGDQARRAAAWLRSLDLPAGSRIAIISKNCAHWIVTDLAIWMAAVSYTHLTLPTNS